MNVRALFGVLAVLAGPALAQSPDNTHEHTLANGLKLIVREDHRAPVVISQIWYRVGSSYEHDGITGVSHALEHMMFKGTAKVPAGEFSRIVTRYGGDDNAFTNSDFTAYYQVYAADRLPLALELEADRMAGLILDEKEFAQEIRVVMEERRWRTDDDPHAVGFERFQSLAYLSAPYRTPVIGWMRDLEKMQLSTLREWYQRWYAPNNAVLVVVGDVRAEQVFTLAERYFGAIPSRAVAAAAMPRELPALGERRLKLRVPGKVPALYLGYNVPGYASAADPRDVYALRMLAAVLDGGVSARLETELVRRQQVAGAISSSYRMFGRGDTLLTLTGVPAGSHTLAELEQALQAEIERLRAAPPTAEEMQRVFAGLLAADVYERDSLSGQANAIGGLESVGLSWRLIDQYDDELRKVTPEDVQRVARTYLVPENMTVLELLPKESS